ncbi:DUF3046 domain-containing protein [Pontimonas sp.]|jgi:hypothetical protein|uniref:DUF3046 domain-containing protein n=1 Tax=Pontimonas sp. TaxID=2304492 RepID=UPI00287058B8|nr:DUF3046 domain-containing protein [Pontimonas sp.]MDR9434880.1 DUF3046 domain-containing protein [Pontimonas sp.]
MGLPHTVTRSEFDRAVADEFGDTTGRTLVRELVMRALGGVTATEALGRGDAPAAVWRALCDEMDVAPPRRYGVGIATPPEAPSPEGVTAEG